MCGFAWGLKGFFIAAPASVLGAAVVFSVLRFSFKERLRAMSKGNEKWQALESVIVSNGPNRHNFVLKHHARPPRVSRS